MKTQRTVYAFIALCTFYFLNACGGGGQSYRKIQEKYRPDVAILQSGESTRSGIPKTLPPEYRVGMLDEIEIRIRYHERYNDRMTVRPDGRITLVDIGDLFITGKTPTEIDQIVTRIYSSIIHDPEVTVSVRTFAGLSIYVFGEVRNGGIFDFQPNMSTIQALAMAGGPIRSAKLNNVVLLRRLETDRPEAIVLDLGKGAIKNGKGQDIFLQPRDIIFVPRTFIASAAEFLDQIYDGLLPPIDAYIRAIRAFDAINTN